jgi:predicted phosphoribosyltransferase
MYLLDPNRGTRRRNIMRDKVVHARRLAREGWEATSHDLVNRSRGLAAAARSRLSPDDADDWVIEQRVRAALGRVVSHPSAVAVNASEGRVTLSGPVLADEVEGLLACARKVRGVEEVQNRLAVHESGEHVPALQGGRTPTGTESEPRHENWTPSLRLLASLGGGGLVIWGLERGGVLGAAADAVGLALFARGITNTPLDRLVGLGGGRRAVDLQKTVTIHAPADRVFAFLTEWERWPQWMSHVREVSGRGTVRGRARSHGLVDGPLGVPVAFEVATALHVPLDVFVVRKLGLPSHPELAIGAIASGGVRLVDESALRRFGVTDSQLAAVSTAEERELERRERLYRDKLPSPDLRGRTLILIDDGLATGASMAAAATAVRAQGPARIVVAVPVAARETCDAFAEMVDEVVCAATPEPFNAVGLWYEDFSQTSDEEVHELLVRAARELPGNGVEMEHVDPTR